jgi:hypothetical protein
MKWEIVAVEGKEGEDGLVVLRASVPGGWLVFVQRSDSVTSGLTFYPDQAHSWTVGDS